MKKILSILSLVMFISVNYASGQVDSVNIGMNPSAFDVAISDTQSVKSTLFDTDDVFEISLAFDITRYKRIRSEDEYFPALLKYYNNETDSVVKKIKVRARGNIRRTGVGMCDFPPLLLNFKMKDSESDEFAGINKLKIVPYCKKGYEQYILKEYICYKLYNILTDYSLKARLFKITYIDSARLSKDPIVQYGFAIEPVAIYEKRTNTKEIEFKGMSQRNVIPDMLDKMAIFNYMIGNTDWSVPIMHNVKLFAPAPPAPANEIEIIPYDFDYAGLVNIDYAIPFEALPIKSVRDRLYMAVCRTEEEFNKTLSEFVEKKDAFYKVINDCQYLSPSSKKDVIKYLDGFFSGIEGKSSTVKKILNDCAWFEVQSNLRLK
jgi:hypothetical protein